MVQKSLVIEAIMASTFGRQWYTILREGKENRSQIEAFLNRAVLKHSSLSVELGLVDLVLAAAACIYEWVCEWQWEKKTKRKARQQQWGRGKSGLCNQPARLVPVCVSVCAIKTCLCDSVEQESGPATKCTCSVSVSANLQPRRVGNCILWLRRPW